MKRIFLSVFIIFGLVSQAFALPPAPSRVKYQASCTGFTKLGSICIDSAGAACVGTGSTCVAQQTGEPGPKGDAGSNGSSAYVYIAYASDASGTGFTTTFNSSLDYVAVKTTTSPIASPQASDFSGLWKNYKGVQGATGATGATGAAGSNGSSAYVYIAYASDASGTGFTTTFNSSLDYVAVKSTTSPIASPQASDFSGLWKNYKGAAGEGLAHTFIRQCTLGGTSTCLDAVAVASIADGDLGIVSRGDGTLLMYVYESSSTATESDPLVVKPDDTTTGRWLCQFWSVGGVVQFASMILPNGTSTPGTCTEGSLFFETDANILWTCTATDTWTNLVGTASNLAFGSDAQYDIPVRGPSAYGRQATSAAFVTFMGTPSLANLGSLLTDEAAGLITFMTTPTLANLASLITDDGTNAIAALGNAINGASGLLTLAASPGTPDGTRFLRDDRTWVTPAGGGNVSNNGTPSLHQFGVWYDSTHVKGVSVTGSKVVCTDSNGEPVACTNLTDIAPSTASSTDTFTNKTLDASATGNVLKQKSYIILARPQRCDGTGATMDTTATNDTYGACLFSASAAYTANTAYYEFAVPADFDSATDLTAEWHFSLSGADTGAHCYKIEMADVADSAARAGSYTNTVNLAFAGDASGASGDAETVAATTLTSWRTSLTAGHLVKVRVGRDGGNEGSACASGAGSTVASYSGPLVLSYTSTQ